MPATPTPIAKPKLLLVEGRDEEEFFGALLRYLKISEIEVRNYQGKTNFRRFLNVFANTPNFDEVQSIGIVRDADDSAISAFQSIQDTLRSLSLPIPEKELSPATGSLRVAVFIMPGNAEGGALEDLCLRALTNDPAMQCVSEFIQCIQQYLASAPDKIAKAKMHAFLASREDPELRLGEAAQRGYLPWSNEAFELIVEFVKGM